MPPEACAEQNSEESRASAKDVTVVLEVKGEGHQIEDGKIFKPAGIQRPWGK